MVKQKYATMTQPRHTASVVPSVKRWLKHSFSLASTNRYFSVEDQKAIATAVQQAEQGHVGEIQVVIEAHLPLTSAYWQNTLIRARQLFAELGTWDTQENSGVLLYLNLCERTVEIVIDRGIHQATTQQAWDEICHQMIALCRTQQYTQAVTLGVGLIGDILHDFYKNNQIYQVNEIKDEPILLD